MAKNKTTEIEAGVGANGRAGLRSGFRVNKRAGLRSDIKSYSYDELRELIARLDQPSFRADQLVEWLYKLGSESYSQMSNLPKSLRETLASEHPLFPSSLIDRQISADGSRKYLCKLHDGSFVETVGLPSLPEASHTGTLHAKVPYTKASHTEALPTETLRVRSAKREDGGKEGGGKAEGKKRRKSKDADKAGEGQRKVGRLSVCVSTQVGCAMACAFCATGRQGFSRNLKPGEIVDQVLLVQKDFALRASNVVFMGQGEPFLNYDNTLAALRFLNASSGLGIGARRMTLSTCGIVPSIERFSHEPEQFTLAVSLHSAIQEVRDVLMPGLVRFPLSQVKEALLDYVKRTGRRVTLEYVLLAGENDGQRDLRALQSFCRELLCHVNLLPANDFESCPYKPSSQKTMKTWAQELMRCGVETTIRISRGADIAGACGQLRAFRR